MSSSNVHLQEEDELSRIPFLILAGGMGTRLQSVLPDIPKSLAPIAGKPFIQILLELLQTKGARHIVLCLGYKAQQISASGLEELFPDLKIDYSIEEQPCGTAGALKLAESYISQRAVVINGDTYFDMDYSALLSFHIEQVKCNDILATLAITPETGEDRYGNILLDDNRQSIIGFIEKRISSKPIEHWINGGVYVIEKRFLDEVPAIWPTSLEKEVFPSILEKGKKLSGFREGKQFFDIGTPDSWCSFAAHYMELIG